MAIPSRQIGWGTEENLLWEIAKQLESLTNVTYNSKKTLLNVEDPYYNNSNIKAKIETFSGAFSGVAGDIFLTIDLNEVQGGIIEYSTYSFNGQGATGTYWFTGQIDGGKYINTTSRSAGNYPIGDSQDGTLINFTCDIGGGAPFEILYTVKLFTLPMYND